MIGREITDEDIAKIEKIFGFKLYDWQIDYIRGKEVARPYGRRTGKTFAYILRLLLNSPFEITEKSITTDEYHGIEYRDWFLRELIKIDTVLKENGFETSFKRRKGGFR